MLKSITILCWLFLLLSCSNEQKKNNLKDSLGKVDPNKSIKIAYPVEKDTTLYTPGVPQITPLPFGPKSGPDNIYKSGKFYSDLIYNNIGKLLNEGWTTKNLKQIKIYKLPLIKKFNYIGIANIDTGKCEDGKPFGDFIKLTKYRYRLPDINKYQCFYWCNYDPLNEQYSRQVKRNCDFCLINSLYGYLMLYNPKTFEANVITIYYNTYRDGSDDSRYFYIDSNYNIHLADFSQEGDDGDGSAPSPIYKGGKHIISILKSGEIAVRKL